jgi:hypothetical protein
LLKEHDLSSVRKVRCYESYPTAVSKSSFRRIGAAVAAEGYGMGLNIIALQSYARNVPIKPVVSQLPNVYPALPSVETMEV